MQRSLISNLFHEEPAGTFSGGHIFIIAPDLGVADREPRSGYWHCDIADEDRLTWSEKVYELFGLPPGVPVDREWAVAHYAESSKASLERVRKYALNRKFGFILDAEIIPEGEDNRWIRVLAIPIAENGRIVALHGLKRAL